MCKTSNDLKFTGRNFGFPSITRVIFISILILWATPELFAGQSSEQDTLVGLVVGKSGKGLRNVPVSVSGSQKQMVTTNRKGIFVITCDTLPDSLNLMLPSKKIVQVPVEGMKFLKILTRESSFSVSEAKDEIINIGYGSEKKSSSVYGGYTISGQELLETGERNIILAIAGKVPGVNVIYKEDGTPGLQIRGGATIDGNTDPLYVIDGSVVDDLSNVNLNDVAKVDILKDGSIYGSRGANGVIIVTTKK